MSDTTTSRVCGILVNRRLESRWRGLATRGVGDLPTNEHGERLFALRMAARNVAQARRFLLAAAALDEDLRERHARRGRRSYDRILVGARVGLLSMAAQSLADAEKQRARSRGLR